MISASFRELANGASLLFEREDFLRIQEFSFKEYPSSIRSLT